MNKMWDKWPRYVTCKGKHSTETYLANSVEDFKEIMRSVIKERFEWNFFGDPSWWFTGTLSEFRLKTTGLTTEELDSIRDLSHKNPHLIKLFEEVDALPRRLAEHEQAMDHYEIAKRVTEGGDVSFGAMYNMLVARSSYQYESFDVEYFSNIN
jgi:uncharacterized protein YdcH (DUF465 family)